MTVEVLTLAATLQRAESDVTAPSLVEIVRRSRSTGSREHINVETIFTASGHPFDYLVMRGDYATDRLIGSTLRVLWLNDQAGEWFIAAWPSGRDGVYHLVSTENTTSDRTKRAERWIQNTREVVRTFLNHPDFESVGIELADVDDVEVGRVTARSVIDGSSDARGWKANGPIERPDPTQVIGALEKDFYSVRTMTLHVGKQLSMHLRRTAGATFYSGSFATFSSHVLDALAQFAADRRSLLANRSRRAQEPSRPLSLRLSTAIFDTPAKTGLILSEMRTLPKITLAVVHRNPYFQASIADEVDGSNLDLIVTSPDTIDLYPGFTCTPGAVERIASQLADRFGADGIANRQERHFSLAELSQA